MDDRDNLDQKLGQGVGSRKKTNEILINNKNQWQTCT
jgi:hypothetical protein